MIGGTKVVFVAFEIACREYRKDLWDRELSIVIGTVLAKVP